MRRFPFAVALAAVVVCLPLGCSKNKEYPQAIKDNFITSCMDGARDKLASDQGDGKSAEERAQAYCRCSLEKIVQHIPLDEFLSIDKAMSSKGAIDPAVAKKLQDTVAECRTLAAPGK